MSEPLLETRAERVRFMTYALTMALRLSPRDPLRQRAERSILDRLALELEHDEGEALPN